MRTKTTNLSLAVRSLRDMARHKAKAISLSLRMAITSSAISSMNLGRFCGLCFGSKGHAMDQQGEHRLEHVREVGLGDVHSIADLGEGDPKDVKHLSAAKNLFEIQGKASKRIRKGYI